MELIESIEAEMKDLRQLDTLESQIREMAALKRERVMALWKLALAGQAKAAVAAVAADAVPIAEAAPAPPVALPKRSAAGGERARERPSDRSGERPFGAPGAPRDLLAESGATQKIENGAGASALLNTANRAPSAQQVFQSLNRLVGGKAEPLKN
jgi:hypothetical protein